MKLQKAGEKIRSNSDALIVIGIGGSYLGARAAIEMLTHTFYGSLSKDKRKSINIDTKEEKRTKVSQEVVSKEYFKKSKKITFVLFVWATIISKTSINYNWQGLTKVVKNNCTWCNCHH